MKNLTTITLRQGESVVIRAPGGDSLRVENDLNILVPVDAHGPVQAGLGRIEKMDAKRLTDALPLLRAQAARVLTGDEPLYGPAKALARSIIETTSPATPEPS
jgi:hypothetical protein